MMSLGRGGGDHFSSSRKRGEVNQTFASNSMPSRSFSSPRHFFKSLDQPLALEAGQALDPEQSVQLIDLMLVADRAQAVGFLDLSVAVEVVIADADARMTPDLVVDTGHRDAAFPM